MSCTDWPEDPVAGKQHTLGGVTYTYDGEKWNGNSDIFNYDRETRWSSVPLTGNPGDPTTAPANWNSSGDETSNWKAERERKIGLWSPWVVTKLRGSDAVDSFTSFVYTRANVKPAQPVGGSFESPVPVGFSDGIPAGELQVWQSQRVFYSDGSEAVVGGVNENDWTDLQPITDTFTTDYEWSSVEVNPGNPTSNPENWSNVASETTIWRAERYKVNGEWGAWTVVRILGENGVSSFQSMVFIRSIEQPATPVGGSYELPVPEGWSDGVPLGEHILWMSTRVFTQTGNPPQTAAWTTPRQMTDTATLDIEWSSVEVSPGNPTDNPENWHNDATPDEWWKAERVKVNGVFGAWQIVKVRGEKGEPGINGTASNLPYTAFCFKKSDTVPATPPASEGSWLNPVPAGWEDGIPAGDFQLYQIKRIFTTDGLAPQDASWSVPAAISNSSTAEYQWSSVQVNPGTPDTNPENWSTSAGTTTVWQAFRQILNGVAQAWQIVKIKGESGDSAGRGFNFFKVGTATGIWSDSDALTPLPLNIPVVNDVVTIYKISDPNVNVTKFWNGAAWELPADGGLFLGSIIVDGSIISRHVAASISMTTPRVNGGTLNGTFLQLFGDNIMIIESPTPFGPDNLLYWVGTKATSGSTPDTIAPVYTAVTKALGKFWIDSSGNVGIRGQVIANSGEFNNVTINENCTILGKLSVGNIEGVITKAQLINIPAKQIIATPGGASSQWKPLAKINIAANPFGLNSTVSFNSLPISGKADVIYESRDPIFPIRVRVKVNGVLDPRIFTFYIPWSYTTPSAEGDTGSAGWEGDAIGTFNLAILVGKSAALIEIEGEVGPVSGIASEISLGATSTYITLLPTSSESIGTAETLP